jgi:acetyltransferase-like isoleucine patch superfamily enzyme
MIFPIIFRESGKMYFLKQMIKKLFTKKFLKCGKNIRFNPFNCYIEYRKIIVGEGVFINKNVYISGTVIIGDNVLIGPSVTIIGGNGYHNFDTVGKLINQQGKGVDTLICIGADSWIAANSILLKGACIGEGSVIGAGSLVTKEMPPYCVCYGIPCKPVRFRYTDEELRKHFLKLGRCSNEAEKIIQVRKRLFENLQAEISR